MMTFPYCSFKYHKWRIKVITCPGIHSKQPLLPPLLYVCPLCTSRHGSVVIGIYGDWKLLPVHAGKTQHKTKQMWSASYKGKQDIIHVVLVISNYTAVVHVKLNERRGGKVAAGEWTNLDEKKDASKGGEAVEGKVKSSKLPWSIKDPRCKKQHLSFHLQWALEGIMSHNISVVQNACRYFDTSLETFDLFGDQDGRENGRKQMRRKDSWQ